MVGTWTVTLSSPDSSDKLPMKSNVKQLSESCRRPFTNCNWNRLHEIPNKPINADSWHSHTVFKFHKENIALQIMQCFPMNRELWDLHECICKLRRGFDGNNEDHFRWLTSYEKSCLNLSSNYWAKTLPTDGIQIREPSTFHLESGKSRVRIYLWTMLFLMKTVLSFLTFLQWTKLL